MQAADVASSRALRLAKDIDPDGQFFYSDHIHHHDTDTLYILIDAVLVYL